MPCWLVGFQILGLVLGFFLFWPQEIGSSIYLHSATLPSSPRLLPHCVSAWWSNIIADNGVMLHSALG